MLSANGVTGPRYSRASPSKLTPRSTSSFRSTANLPLVRCYTAAPFVKRENTGGGGARARAKHKEPEAGLHSGFCRRFRAYWLALDESFFQHLLVAEPQIGDIGGAEPKNIFQSAPDFFEPEVHANLLEQFD